MVISWLVRVVAGLALGALILYELGAIAVNHVTLDTTANDIALAVATDVPERAAVAPRTLEDLARPLAQDAGARLVGVTIDEERDVNVELRRTARTLLVRRIEPLRRYGRAVVTGEASSG